MPKYLNKHRYTTNKNTNRKEKPRWKRHFGSFICECGSSWDSAWVFEKESGGYWTQDCRKCDSEVEPFIVEDLECSWCDQSPCECTEEEKRERREDGIDGAHMSELCSKCRAGYPCGKK